jgi:pimeloyl-ACP methyl ester carboxylesterase
VRHLPIASICSTCVWPGSTSTSLTISHWRRTRRAGLLGSTAAWTAYLDLAVPTKPVDWDAELARIVAKLREPGRMEVLQTMGRSSPADAGDQLPRVTCPVLVIEGGLDPDWPDPRAEGERIVAELPEGLGTLAVIERAGHYPHAETPDEVLALSLPFLVVAFDRG